MDFQRLPKEIALQIFSHLSPTDQKSARLICHDINDIFLSPQILPNYALVMNGSGSFLYRDQTVSLVSTLTPWVHLKFTEDFDILSLLDMEGTFTTLIQSLVGPSLKSLTISGCTLSLGRFMELVSYTPSLIELILSQVPSLYEDQNPVQLLNWKDFIIPFQNRLRSLQKLSLDESDNCALNDDRTLWFLLDNTTSLRYLKVYTNRKRKYEYPTNSVVRGIERNSTTLRELDLSGNDHLEPLSLWSTMSPGKFNLVELHTLRVSSIRMDGFEDISPTLCSLKCLELKDVGLEYESFLDIGKTLPNLKDLTVRNCSLENGILRLAFGGARALKRVEFSENRMAVVDSEGENETILDQYVHFFDSGPKSLDDIKIVGDDTGALVQNLARAIIIPNMTYPARGSGYLRKVRRLRLSHFQGFQDPAVITLLAEMGESLETLDFSYSDVNDDWSPAFAKMKGLVCLYLHHTLISGEILKGLISLPKLKEFDLNETPASVDDTNLAEYLDTLTFELVDSEFL